jgi:hypothetical protein
MLTIEMGVCMLRSVSVCLMLMNKVSLFRMVMSAGFVLTSLISTVLVFKARTSRRSGGACLLG